MKQDCPYCLAIGMTYEEYWYGDPLMVRDYYKADRLRKRREDENAWMQGLYFLSALKATFGNMFLRPGQEAAEYPEEPISRMKEREKREKTEREKEQEAVWAKAWMTGFVQAGKNWKKKG